MHKSIQSKEVSLRGTVSETGTEELLRLIPGDELARIMSEDPHPVFIELSVGHEGVSTGRVLWNRIRTSIRKIWNRAVVEELAEKIQPGTPVFDGHDRDNNPRRVEVGRVLYRYVKELGGQLFARAVAYIHDPATRERIRTGERDCNSIEAVLQFEPDEVGDWIVRGVERVTGIALASRKHGDIPGFAGATIVSAIQCLSDQNPPDPEDETGKHAQEIARLTNDLAEKDSLISEQERTVKSLQENLNKARSALKAHEVGGTLQRLVDEELKGKNLPDALRSLIHERVKAADYREVDDTALTETVSRKVQDELRLIDEVHKTLQKSPLISSPLGQEHSGPLDYLNPSLNAAIPRL